MNESRILRCLYIGIALLIVNLAATGYLVFYLTRNSSQPIALNAPAAGKQIARDKAQAFAKPMVDRYNAKDVAGLYAQFDPVAKMQFTQDKIAEVVDKLHQLGGRVDDFAYSHLEPAGNHNGKDFLTLHYKVRLSGGVLSSGEMKLTVVQDGDELALYGFFINALQQ